jgi:hypothetical protein
VGEIVYGWREGDTMQTVLYVYESQNNNGWKWCAVQTDERIGEVQRMQHTREPGSAYRLKNKPEALAVGVNATEALGIDLDRVEFCRPSEPKPVAQPDLAQMAGLRHTDDPARVVYARPPEEMRQMSLTIGKLTHELEETKRQLAQAQEDRAVAMGERLGYQQHQMMLDVLVASERQDLAETKTALAAALREKRRLPDQIEQVNRWHTWADATLGLIAGRAVSATYKQNAIALQIQWLKDRVADQDKTFAKLKCML